MPNYSDTRVNDMIFNVLDSTTYNTLLNNNQLNNNQLYFITDDNGSIIFTQNNSTLATFTGNNNITIDLTTMPQAVADSNGNNILATYANALTVSGTTLTLKAKNGDTLSTVTTQDTKNTAGSTNSTSKLYLIGATGQSANPQTYSSNKVYVTDGTLTATTFSGNLSGNASTATLATKATGDANGNAILSNYASTLESSGNSLILKAKNGDTLSTVTVATSDTKVNVTLGTTSKAYILATTTTPTSTAAGVTSIADTGVYLGTTAGELVATKFTGDLNGNAATATSATKATGDANGNAILSNYASTLSASGTTLTLKAKNGDTLSTVTTQDTKNTAGSTNSTSKLFLIGATSQAANPQTYSSSKVYVTDGTITATTFSGNATSATTAVTADKATGDANGNPILSTYASTLESSDNSLILKAKNGDTLSTVTVATSDIKVNVKARGTTKAYVLGTTTSPTSSDQAVTSVAETGVYFDTTAAKLVATTFKGALEGNASTATLATKATGDGNGNEILSKYASELVANGTTLTLKAKNGDTLSTVTTQDNDTKNTAGSTNSTSKLFLVGTTSQAASVQTYSSSKVYVTDGTLTATTFSGSLSGNATSATNATNATNDSGGNKITDHYIHDITVSGTTLTLKDGDGDTIKTITTQDNDTKNTAGSTQSTSKLYLIGATSQAANPQTYSSSKVYVTDGTITATTFAGNATSATTATKATGDANGNAILSNYASELTISGTTLILKAKNGDTLSTITAPWLSLSGGTVTGTTQINRNIFTNITSVPENGETVLTALGFKTGYPVYTDPLFESGTNNVNLYNNNNSSAPYTSVTRMTYTDAGINSPGTGSNYVIRIQNTGSGTAPGLGGFYQTISSRANAVFVQIFRALIPIGYTLYTASNSMGNNYSDVWLTDPKGTGKWEWYARRVLCGKDGSFSSGGHVYLNGTAGTTSAPINWYLSYCNLYDLTKAQYDGLRTRYADSATSATSATYDAAGNNIEETYIKSLSFSIDSNGNSKYTTTTGDGTTSDITPVVAQIIRW